MGATSTQYISAVASSTGGLITDMWPLFILFFGTVLALFVFTAVYKATKGSFRALFK